MSHHVIVLGGGVAGMSAAHELIERGFRVTVYEKGVSAGGKARSFGVAGTGTDGRLDLPAEHGFRFFPGFYRHLPDTMKRIPYGPDRQTVFDNLVNATQMAIHFEGQRHLVVPARFPRSLREIRQALTASGYLTTRTGLTPDDIQFYVERVWELLTTCEERRAEQFESQDWWQFIDAANRSARYQGYLGRTPRVLVAADPEVANTKTVGDILLQLLFNLGDPGVAADRVLNGPTSEVWIDPWLRYLRQRGVRYHENVEVLGFRCAGGRIAGVRLSMNGTTYEVAADYYVAALPVEKMAPLVTPDMTAIDETLGGIKTLAAHVDWMSGIQFYLLEDLPLNFGHQMFLSSPWALTSLSQVQFWYDRPESFARRYGDGTVRAVLSVDVSDWNTPSPRTNKKARDHARADVPPEVWRQLRDSLPDLRDEFLHPQQPWLLDPAIRQGGAGLVNDEPLLVNVTDSWQWRPWPRTRIPNLFLASDYVRTYTNLATMEAANEAARRAVNGIIDATGVRAAPCRLWSLHEPVWVKPWRWWDLLRYRRGEPWGAQFPELVETAARAVLESAPAVGSPDGYADAQAREAIEHGVSLVPSYVQHDIIELVLDVESTLELGDVDGLRACFDAEAGIELAGRPRVSARAWLDGLPDFFAEGGRIDMDVRRVQDIRPVGLGIAARLVADVAMPDAPTATGPGWLDLWFVRTHDERGRATGPWRIGALRYSDGEGTGRAAVDAMTV
jgi:uncharacterized protein with NAD-binding domain and iron-sulfur cluster